MKTEKHQSDGDCTVCNHGWQEYERNMRRHIAQFGRGITGVAGSPSFAYTIGNTEADRVDLLIVAHLALRDMQYVLNAVSERLPSDRSVPREVDIGGKYPVRLHECTRRAYADYTFQLPRFYPQRPLVAQVIVFDKEGRFPGDAGCKPPFNDQPKLW